ncbi:MAG TPA: NAD(+) synthase, partial [Gaiellaceae bacterium]
VRKNGFEQVLVGVSGGIDSALTAALAVEALGPDAVHCVSMPSRYSSEATRTDASRLAESLGCAFREIQIERVFEAFLGVLAPVFTGREPDLTEENLQARIRGTLLMALSNKFGWLLVATGNKSELSVGYATLYGDMAGGFALLKDVFKTDVFRLSRHLGTIPQSIIDRAPSAELRDDQLDEDSLPPYPALDQVLEAYLGVLAPFFAGREPDLTEENLQARIRGTLLMALSNKFGWLLVATGNKSELSVGYATLYGDMAGGFALLKDVYKTDVFRLSRHLNEQAGRELIPQSIIDRAPSAELRDDQLDEDSLPPYPALDRVLEAYVEQDRSLEELSADGFDPDVVERAVAMIDRAEYKRRQAPPGVRLRPKAFGRDRRTPITNRWRS